MKTTTFKITVNIPDKPTDKLLEGYSEYEQVLHEEMKKIERALKQYSNYKYVSINHYEFSSR